MPANYQAFAVIAHVGESKETGHYVALVRKQDYNEDVLKWYKFEDERITKIRENCALHDYQPVLIFYRIKPNLKQVPEPLPRELKFITIEPAPAKEDKRKKDKKKSKDKKHKRPRKHPTQTLLDKQSSTVQKLFDRHQKDSTLETNNS